MEGTCITYNNSLVDICLKTIFNIVEVIILQVEGISKFILKQNKEYVRLINEPKLIKTKKMKKNKKQTKDPSKKGKKQQEKKNRKKELKNIFLNLFN